jgi:hypothetical protein
MKKYWHKFLEVLDGLNWTVAGTVLVLITLSGPTKSQGIQIFVFALLLHLLIAVIKPSDEE